jgi:hypothetical protein
MMGIDSKKIGGVPMPKLLTLFGLICIAMAGCPETPETPAVPKPAVSPVTPQPPKATAAPETPDVPETPKASIIKFGFELCGQMEGDSCKAPLKVFGTDQPVIHAALVSPRVPRKTGQYTVRWIAVDTGGAAPPNHEIAAVKGVLEGWIKKIATHATVHGQLSRPDKGWPVGSYRVEVLIEGAKAASADFEIKASK